VTAPVAVLAATSVAADGSAALAPADLLTVLDALADAAGLRQARGATACLDCIGGQACDLHQDDQDQADAYRAVAARLGDYR
jgi:hypothetical protein